MSDQTIRNSDNEENVSFSRFTGAADALAEKLADALTPGFEAECSPLEAERAGAFREDALSEADAMDSAVSGDSFNVDDELPESDNVIVGAFPTRNMAGQREA